MPIIPESMKPEVYVRAWHGAELSFDGYARSTEEGIEEFRTKCIVHILDSAPGSVVRKPLLISIPGGRA